MITLENSATNDDVVASDFTFEDRIAEGVSFYGASLTRVAFIRCDLYWASFFMATLTEVIFDGCDLRGSDFKRAILANCRFLRCDLGDDALGLKTRFDGTDLSLVTFHNCNGP